MRVVRVNLRLAVALAALGMAAPAHADHVSAHAMVYTCCTPLAGKEKVFREAAAMHADYIRVDVELNGDQSRLDEIVRLSRRFNVPVLGLLIVPPNFTDAAGFGRLAGQAVERAHGGISHWEVMNEPDADYAFHGTPEQYARILSAAYDAIKRRTPGAQVSTGGLVDPKHTDWLARVFATPGADALHKFDIASLHLRGPVDLVVNRYREFRAWLGARGFHGPVWVTEHGYPADPQFQIDPAFKGSSTTGSVTQAEYLTQSLVGLGEAGAPEVFVTLRDNSKLLPQNITEGIVGRPAFDAVRRVADEWDELLAWRAEQHENERAAFGEIAAARASSGEARAAGERARAAGRRVRALARGASAGRLARARAFFAGSEVAFLWHAAGASRHRELAREHAAAAKELANRVAWHPSGG